MADVANNAYEGRLYAENAVIGSLLIDENAAPGILAAVNAGDIQIQQNRQIYQAARALMLDGLPVDPVLIRDKLGKNIEGHILQLMEIAEDGVISDSERELFDEIACELGDIVQAALALQYAEEV